MPRIVVTSPHYSTFLSCIAATQTQSKSFCYSFQDSSENEYSAWNNCDPPWIFNKVLKITPCPFGICVCVQAREGKSVYGYKWERLQQRTLWKVTHYLLGVLLPRDISLSAWWPWAVLGGGGRGGGGGYFRKTCCQRRPHWVDATEEGRSQRWSSFKQTGAASEVEIETLCTTGTHRNSCSQENSR